jgi:uncharacterized protein (DUF2249 family)
MTAQSDSTDVTRLDAREIDGEPFGAITAALDDLAPAGTLLLINSFEPVPLYDVLDRRGFVHETTQVDEAEWHVEIRHAD